MRGVPGAILSISAPHREHQRLPAPRVRRTSDDSVATVMVVRLVTFLRVSHVDFRMKRSQLGRESPEKSLPRR
jgi:hypothetical protein